MNVGVSGADGIFYTVPYWTVEGILASSTTDRVDATGGSRHCGEDRDALVALYSATNGEDWRRNDNWLSSRPIHIWYGVTADGDGCVTSLSLQENQLSGEISPELGNLSSLERLDLGENQLTGEIPAQLANLSSLEWLNLGENQLTGTIPIQLGNLASLESLYLFNNNLSGEIPPQLGDLAKLEYLGLGDNKLTGNIPAELGNLARLKGLQLSENQLRGCVPSSLRNQLQNKYTSLDDLPFCRS